MVIVTKKNGKPCRTIDLQKLNAQCCQETLSVTPSFGMSDPSQQKKDYSKGANEFHAIEIVRLVIKQQHLFQNGEGIAVIVYLKGT